MAAAKDVSIKITPVVDTEAMDQLKATAQAIGASFAEVAGQMKATFEEMGKNVSKAWAEQMPSLAPKPITPEQIAHAYGVPPELIGLLPPDAGETITQAAFDGTLTGEVFVHGVLPPGECPANTAPYVSGQLGINSMLVAQQPTGWQGKTSTEILADIQAAIAKYKGQDMPKKVFPAKQPGEGSGIPAHAVFTSPLIHSKEQAEATAKKLLKTTGDVKVNQLDEHGNPTGKWITLGQVGDFNLEPMDIGTPWHTGMTLGQPVAEDVQVSEDDHGVSMKVPLSNHAMGTAIDINGIVASGGHSAPDPDQMHFEVTTPVMFPQVTTQKGGVKYPLDFVELGHAEAIAEALEQKKAVDGLQEKITSMQHQTFDVLGKAQPIVVTGPGKFSTTYKLAHDAVLIEYPDGMATLDLPGMVHVPGKGHYKLHAKLTLTTGQARKIAGLDPLGHDDTLDATIQWAYGEPFVWHAEHGWMPVKWKPVSTEDDLFTEEKPAAPPEVPLIPARTWCLFHKAHWSDPTHQPIAGKAFECGSGTWSRESTPLEDKQVLAKIDMMRETGLL